MFKYIIISILLLSSCGNQEFKYFPPNNPYTSEEDVVIKGRALVEVNSDRESRYISLIKKLFLSYAYAATGTTTVTYSNAASVNFTIDVSNFTPGSFTGDSLSLGNVSLSGINDNHLKVCNPGGNTKCTQATIRVYTTGSIAGFVNTANGYGIPLYTGSLNPSTQVGLNTSGSVPVQTITIAANKNRLRMSDFPSPQYSVTSDFSNAGSGSYTMTYVVEYVLSP